MEFWQRRGQPLAAQFARFGAVGALGFVVDVGGFNLLRFAGGDGPLHDYPLSAKVASGAAATVVSWLGNRYWAFRHSRRHAAHHEFLLFTVMASVGTGIAMGCLWFSHYVLDLRSPLADNISANVVGLALAMTFRFWAYRRHVFGAHGDGSGLSEVVERHEHPEDYESAGAGPPPAEDAALPEREAPSVSGPA